MIDLVVPYVDFQDENWLKTAKENGIEKPSITRFRGQGDFFKYFFRCVDKNISWINNIFLLVQSESQVPKWIDKTKVKVVLHEDFIPKKFLPLYNSCTIEMFLHNIPDLSEKFLYFNDDMYATRELNPNDFFENDKVKQHFNPYFPQAMFGSHTKNGYKINFDDDKQLMPSHSVQPLLKSKVKECFELNKETILNSISKIREEKNFNVYIYTYYLLKNDLCEDSKVIFKYFERYGYYAYLCLKTCQILCLNDNFEDYYIYEDKKINEWFECHFQEKSKYEL